MASLRYAILCSLCASFAKAQVVVNTWFPNANAAAFELVNTGYAALDAIEVGTTFCETAQCDGTVGWGNHPDTTGALDYFLSIL